MEEYLKEFYEADWDSEPPVRIRKFTRRVDLPKLFNHLGFKRGAEIGVDCGRNAKAICRRMPDVELLCIDPWKTYEVDRRTHRMGLQEARYEIARKRLERYPKTICIRATSMEAVRNIGESSLDFIHIDGNHYYEYISEDLIEWSKRVRPDGIVSGHDYAVSSNSDVIRAVQEYVEKNGVKRWFITDEPAPSYFWMKQ